MTPKQFVVALAVVWAATGLVEPFLPDAGEPVNAIGFVHGVLMAILLFGWCKAHARANAIRPPAGAALLVALISPLGVPYYALRSFGWRRGLGLIGWSSVTLVAFVAIYFVCFEISAWFLTRNPL